MPAPKSSPQPKGNGELIDIPGQTQTPEGKKTMAAGPSSGIRCRRNER